MFASILKMNMTKIAINDVKYILKNEAPKLAKWGIPAVFGIGWFIFPALTPSFKEESLGL
jgi:hypothetical protein